MEHPLMAVPPPTVERRSAPPLSRFLRPLARLSRSAGIDRAVAYTLVGRVWTAVSGVLTLYLLTRFLSPVQQGFYVTFNSLLALQVFFELGLTYVILQFASHERAELEWTTEGTLAGEGPPKSRLASLLRASFLWYAVIAVLMTAVLLPAGLAFFGHQGGSSHAHVSWRWPWVWVVLVCGSMLAVSPIYAVLEGCGLVAEVALIQTGQNVLSSVLLWLGLSQHWALFAAPFSTAASFLYGVSLVWRRHRPFLRDLLRAYRPAVTLSWRREIWPFQWKIGLSFLSGYFIFCLFNPILFHYYGAVAAGQMGLSYNVMAAVSAIAAAWVTTKSAPFGSLIARRDFAQLDRLFFPTLWRSAVVVLVGGILVWGGDWSLHQMHHPLAARLLGPLPMGLLVTACVIQHITFTEALYLRAHKQEPFLYLSLFVGLLAGLSNFFLGRAFGATGMMFGYCLINGIVGLGGGTWIFVQKRRAWHGPLEPAA